MAVPGWPFPALCTESMARARTISTVRRSRSVHSKSLDVPARCFVDVSATALLMALAWRGRSSTRRHRRMSASSSSSHNEPTQVEVAYATLGAAPRSLPRRAPAVRQHRRRLMTCGDEMKVGWCHYAGLVCPFSSLKAVSDCRRRATARRAQPSQLPVRPGRSCAPTSHSPSRASSSSSSRPCRRWSWRRGACRASSWFTDAARRVTRGRQR